LGALQSPSKCHVAQPTEFELMPEG